jgi:hypothetical protein
MDVWIAVAAPLVVLKSMSKLPGLITAEVIKFTEPLGTDWSSKILEYLETHDTTFTTYSLSSTCHPSLCFLYTSIDEANTYTKMGVPIPLPPSTTTAHMCLSTSPAAAAPPTSPTTS